MINAANFQEMVGMKHTYLHAEYTMTDRNKSPANHTSSATHQHTFIKIVTRDQGKRPGIMNRQKVAVFAHTLGLCIPHLVSIIAKLQSRCAGRWRLHDPQRK